MKIESEGLAVASLVVHTAACAITKIHGFKVAANDRFLQLHNTKGTPTKDTILRVWPIYGTAPFGEGFIGDPVLCSEGAVFAVSSTANTYTASAETVDIFVNGESNFDTKGISVAGDYTTADEVLQVWADASGPKKLYRLEASDVGVNSGGVFVQIHAGDVPATDKIVAVFELSDGGTIDEFFGGGLSPLRRVSGTEYKGCTIAVSSTRNTYTALGSNIASIKASYRDS